MIRPVKISNPLIDFSYIYNELCNILEQSFKKVFTKFTIQNNTGKVKRGQILASIFHACSPKVLNISVYVSDKENMQCPSKLSNNKME